MRKQLVCTCLAAGAVVALAVAGAGGSAEAAARPDPGPTCSTGYVVTRASTGSLPLRRIGAQLVRGDYLTGGGVIAPDWVPEITEDLSH